jgi:uncharacterized protein YcfJ
MIRTGLLGAGLAALLLTGCQSPSGSSSGPRSEFGCLAGTVTGAVAGGLIGSAIGGGGGRLVATGVGVAAGGVGGNLLACQ